MPILKTEKLYIIHNKNYFFEGCEIMKMLFNEHKKLIRKIAEQVIEEQMYASQHSKKVRQEISEHKKRMEERRKKFSLIRNK